MRAIVLAALACLAFGGPAVAAEKSHGEQCVKASELSAKLPKKSKIDALNPGAFHIAEGLWMATPPLTAGIPDVDGAIIITISGKSKVFFTHGKESCLSHIVLALPPLWVHALLGAKALPDEKAEPKDELHL